MPRAIWSGALSFGLVNVPVKLYSATGRKAVRFHQLNRKDGVRIQQRRVDPSTGEEVAYDDIVKGYEIAPDQYVVVTPEELEALDPAATRTIDIEEFVELAQIDPVYFDSSYYLAPAAGGAKPYALLLAAMRDSGRVALAKMVLRSRQHLAAVRASGEVLTLSTMLYADEVVSPDALDEIATAQAPESSEREVKMARQLIESLAADFDPTRFHDEYREKVLQLIERKAAGEEIAVQPEAPAPAPVPDLMAALEASIAAARDRTDKSGGSRRRAAAEPASDRAGKKAAKTAAGSGRPKGGSDGAKAGAGGAGRAKAPGGRKRG